MRILFWILFLGLCRTSFGQMYFTEVHSRWDDRYNEWEILGMADEEELMIRVSLIWPLKNNWEEWRIDGDSVSGTIKTKWRGDLSQWELRTRNEIIMVSQDDRDDVNRWEIREGTYSEILSTLYYNNSNVWHVPQRRDNWLMSTEFNNDSRDWRVEDYMENKSSVAFRLAMIFIALWQSIPK